ncbi:MAG: ABC transporter ATP-binding protein [Terrimicrobiaceae bacterium]
MIAWEGVSKKFHGRPAVESVTFRVEAGEIFGLLGHNGAGKSTTFGMALGHVHPDAGRVMMNGHDVVQDREKALGRTGAIFETPAFYDYLSGWKNLMFLVSLSGEPEKARVEEAVELVGLRERIHDPVKTYSHGMRQRLALAQALLPGPSLILLDEPTEGLDPAGIHEMREMILRLREERGLTVVLSSHLLHEVELLCDRVAILQAGHLIFCGAWQKAAPTRWKIVTVDEVEAGRVLEGLGCRRESAGVWTPSGEASDAVAALVAAGVRVAEFRRVVPTLEDFYLKRTGG